MPIIVDLLSPGGNNNATAEEQRIVRPNIPLHLGCEVLTKEPSITITKGQDALIEWVLRDKLGRPVDITGALAEIDGEPGCVEVRIRNALSGSANCYTLNADVIDATNGVVQFSLPAKVRDNACLYSVELAVRDGAGAIMFSRKGLLSVERGLYGDTGSMLKGALTLEEIRMELRDRTEENDLLRDVEFDDVELLYAITSPIRYWNEIPPDVARYSACNFPYHGHWLRATCGHLLRVAANWYERNRIQGTGGGLSLDDRNKMQQYTALSRQYLSEWELFVERKKIEINAAGCYGAY